MRTRASPRRPTPRRALSTTKRARIERTVRLLLRAKHFHYSPKFARERAKTIVEGQDRILAARSHAGEKHSPEGLTARERRRFDRYIRLALKLETNYLLQKLADEPEVRKRKSLARLVEPRRERASVRRVVLALDEANSPSAAEVAAKYRALLGRMEERFGPKGEEYIQREPTLVAPDSSVPPLTGGPRGRPRSKDVDWRFAAKVATAVGASDGAALRKVSSEWARELGARRGDLELVVTQFQSLTRAMKSARAKFDRLGDDAPSVVSSSALRLSGSSRSS